MSIVAIGTMLLGFAVAAVVGLLVIR